ncbi:unnamed protein product [Sphagnum compactum]
MWGARGARLWLSLKRMGKEGTSRGESWKSMFTAPEAAAIAAQDFILEGARSGLPVQQHLLREVARSVGLAGRANGKRQREFESLYNNQRLNTALILQQRLGISTRVESLQSAAVEGGDQPVRSPLSQAPAPTSSVAGSPKAAVAKKQSQAVLTMIKQSPKKVNLVAELVRGMRVDDALMQMAVSPKRAAKVVAKVVHSARANAVHNYGLNKDRLIVAEAFVGKDKYLKRLRIHGKGKAGRMVHPRCRLTVILKELSPEKEAELARLRVQKLHGKQLYAANAKLVPHRVVQTQWQWSRKPSNRTLSPA